VSVHRMNHLAWCAVVLLAALGRQGGATRTCVRYHHNREEFDFEIAQVSLAPTHRFVLPPP
jgi:hypothetical protein